MLFSNEQISFREGENNTKYLTDEQLSQKYLKGEIRVITEQARYPLDTITTLLKSGKYILKSDFQRRARWDLVRRSRFIESLIMNIPTPPIYLYENELSHYEVVDGLQRLTTIKMFYENDFELTGLDKWPELNGRRYLSLPKKIRQGLDRRYISSTIVMADTALKKADAQMMKKLIFERLNNGGVELERQEIRNALYPGNMNDLCHLLSLNPRFQYLMGLEANSDLGFQQLTLFEEVLPLENDEITNKRYLEMEDVEFVLRFFAMRQIELYTQASLSDFLDKYIIEANRFSTDLIDQLKNLFEETIELVHELFGIRAFELYRKKEKDYQWVERPTSVIYDPLMQVVSNLVSQKDIFLSQKNEINSDLLEFYKANQASFGGRNVSRIDIEKRITLFNEFFAKYTK